MRSTPFRPTSFPIAPQVLLLCALPLLAPRLAAQEPAAETPPAAPAAADTGALHWSQWRGPHRDGRDPGAAWPARLTAENFQQQWRVELAPSYSGPVTDGSLVFTTETVDEFEEVVRAFDRKTGEQRWQAGWEGAIKVPFFAARNGSWIRSTPAIDGDRLYVAGMRDVLVCFDTATGAERWRVDLVKALEAPVPEFGFVCSPLVHGEHVFVQAGASFVKLDKHTGEIAWHTLRDSGGMWGSAFSSPVVATLGGVEQVLVQTRQRLCGVSPDSGDELWGVDVKSFRGMNILTPTPWREGVFTSAYGGRAHYFGVDRAEAGLAVAERWTNRAQGYMTSPVVVDDHAYLFLRSQRFTCVDLETGESTWTSEPIGDTYWSLVAQGDRMLALTDRGELLLIQADPAAFRVVDRLRVADAETWAHLAIDGGQVFIRELHALTAFAWAE